MGKIAFGQIGHKLQKSNSLEEIADGNGDQVGPHFLCAFRATISQANLSPSWRQVGRKEQRSNFGPSWSEDETAAQFESRILEAFNKAL